jgi:lipopolysaccharide/colanic/teichoic acid biosynthesis glycosyltransferase
LGHHPSDFSFGLDGSRPGGCVLKRGIDIVLAAVMLILSLPLLTVCAFLVKLDSRGPVFFRQVRMGRNFRTFNLLKLRTMRAGEEGPAITLGFDPRITRLGRWLRRWKLDELPQLWNVVRGEMSLVGPRPVIPELTREFAADYRHLLQVRPGLTDPATVQYCHEAEILSHVPAPLDYFKTVVTPEKLRLSRLYLRHATVMSDFAVMAKTGLALMSPVRPLVPAPGYETLRHPASPVSVSRD